MVPVRHLRSAGQLQCGTGAAAAGAAPRAVPRRASQQAGARRAHPQQLAAAAPVVPAQPFSSRSTGRRAVVRPLAAAATEAPPAAPTPPPEVQVPIEGVVCLPVTKAIKCLRGVCNERLKYEVEYSLKKGTSENSYLLQGTGYNVLIDVPYKAFSDAFVPALSAEVAPSQLTHIIITHLGPNRFPTLKAVLEAALQGRPADKPIKLVVTNPARSALQKGLADVLEGAGPKIQWVVVKASGDEAAIPITPAYSLTAVLTPTPRWPDAMCIIDPASRVVFTSKFFSAHVAPGLLNSKAATSAFDLGSYEAYGDHWRYFYDCMLAPMATQAESALDKLPVTATPRASLDTPASFMTSVLDSWSSLVADITRGSKGTAAGATPVPARLFAYSLAPQHGPVIRTCLSRLSQEYRKWTQEQVAALNSSNVVVMYASAYGNTAALAQAISRGLVKAGVAVNTVNLEVTALDDVVAAVKASDGFTIGSPTLGGHMPTPVQLALGSILRQGGARELPCGVFGSFGWSGEAVDEMEGKLTDGGYSFAFNPIKVKFKPTATDLGTCELAGRDLAVQVKRRQRNKEMGSMTSMAAVTASGAQLALGRLVGSLAVVTARDEEFSTGMLASWVSQASFDPPGITVAVAKERTIETLLQPGAPFAVSMVAESQAKRIMKVMSKPFTPGANRLASLVTTTNANTGCPVLDTATAVLECKVVSRMETGDHWVVYAEVTEGEVGKGKEAELTAVHHRKVGNHY